MTELVLSLFPGIGLIDRGFERAGFAVVRGPDPLWCGDIRHFHVPAGKFFGVIGGPPCQKFSMANRNRDVAGGMELVREFIRIVCDAAPEFALMENVAGSPHCDCPGYRAQRFMLDASHVGSEQHRLRKFHFFHRPGTPEIVLQRGDRPASHQRTCMASEAGRKNRRDWNTFCRLQGLPPGFDLPGFTVAEKYRAVGNGVPFEMACALATAIRNRDRFVTPHRVCECGCGEFVTGRAILATAACRKRMQRQRDLAASQNGKLQMEFA